MQTQQIPISWTRRQAKRAIADGLSLEQLYSKALIEPKFGDDRDVITPLQMTLFHAVLVLETNDATHSMLAHRLDPVIGPLSFRLLFGSANLGDGLEAFITLFKNSARSIRYELSTQGSQAFIAIHADGDDEGSILQEDVQLIYLYQGLTCFLGRAFPVSWAATRDPSHINLGGTHYATGSTVRLSNCAGLSFPKALLQCAPPNPTINEFVWRPIRDALQLMEAPADECQDGVSNESFRVDKLAADRMMAPSTFRRKLAHDGLSFRQMRERALLKATLELLQSRTCSVEAIAGELGYADARSLRRFVKRATGRTPHDIRTDISLAVPPARVHSRLNEVISLIAG